MYIVKKALKLSKIFQTWISKNRVRIQFQIFLEDFCSGSSKIDIINRPHFGIYRPSKRTIRGITKQLIICGPDVLMNPEINRNSL